jgi:hypothetical protein
MGTNAAPMHFCVRVFAQLRTYLDYSKRVHYVLFGTFAFATFV